jgi:hypothetical protein
VTPRSPPKPRPSVRADRLAPGWVLTMATGPVTVLRIEPTHGGQEVLVRPLATQKGKGTGKGDRVLWFWPQQTVNATHGDAATPPRATISRREASRATAAKRKAQGGVR